MKRCLVRGFGGTMVACLVSSCGGTVELRDDPGAASNADPQITAMAVDLGQASYQFLGCKGPTGAVAGSDGAGPMLQLKTEDSTPPPCGVQWPATNPALYLSVLFRNFLPSVGPPTGLFDVSETDKVVIELDARSQLEVPVDQRDIDARAYRSDEPGSLGTVTSTRIDTTQSSSSDYLFRIDLANVKLGASTPGGGVVSFPDQASISRATLYFQKLR